MTSNEFVERIKGITAYKTLYVNGAWGWPMTEANKARATKRNPYNRLSYRREKIMAASPDTFGFDCVCMIKGILWGWSGKTSLSYGGAGYAINGVPDVNADQMIKLCQTSTDWPHIIRGSVVWLKGHIGVYIGDGLVVEATPIWQDGVQITSLNVPRKGYNYRKWTCWGTLPFIDYSEEEDEMFSYEDFKKYMAQYEEELAKKPADKYAQEALKWAKENGISIGDEKGNLKPQTPVKREDAVLMLYRAEKLK